VHSLKSASKNLVVDYIGGGDVFDRNAGSTGGGQLYSMTRRPSTG